MVTVGWRRDGREASDWRCGLAASIFLMRKFVGGTSHHVSHLRFRTSLERLGSSPATTLLPPSIIFVWNSSRITIACPYNWSIRVGAPTSYSPAPRKEGGLNKAASHGVVVD